MQRVRCVAGKSSLLDMITGERPLHEGHREVGETTALGYFRQHVPHVKPTLKIIDYIRCPRRCCFYEYLYIVCFAFSGLPWHTLALLSAPQCLRVSASGCISNASAYIWFYAKKPKRSLGSS